MLRADAPRLAGPVCRLLCRRAVERLDRRSRSAFGIVRRGGHDVANAGRAGRARRTTAGPLRTGALAGIGIWAGARSMRRLFGDRDTGWVDIQRRGGRRALPRVPGPAQGSPAAVE